MYLEWSKQEQASSELLLSGAIWLHKSKWHLSYIKLTLWSVNDVAACEFLGKRPKLQYFHPYIIKGY